LSALKVETDIVVAIADPVVRKRLHGKIKGPVAFPSLIHPGFNPGSNKNNIGYGCILTAGSILTTGITIGNFVIINLLTSIGHDVVIGDFSSVMPGCSISGNVRVGECSLIGTGARILQNLVIGNRCKVGAGAVVTTDIPDDTTAVGIPAAAIKA